MQFYTTVIQYKGQILTRGYRDGKRFSETVNYNPYLFVPVKNDHETPYRTIDNKRVDKLIFESIYEAKDFVKKYEDVDGFNFYGLTNFPYTFIYDNYPGEIKYDPRLISIVVLDLECRSDDGFPDIQLADKEITAITLRKNGKSLIFGCGEYIEEEDATYIRCQDESDLLLKFLHYWNTPEWNPDIVTGWNIEFFDIPYIVNRITRVLGAGEAKRLSPFKILHEKTITIRGRENQAFSPLGVDILDYMHLYKKFSFTNQESYKLEFIAQAVLGIGKLDYSEYGGLEQLYARDHQKFIEYNNRDTIIIEKMEKKLGFIGVVLAIAYDAKVNYSDTLTTVRPWDVIVHNHLLDKGIVIPKMEEKHLDRALVGGYVKEPQVGMHEWVVSFDYGSLYPRIIMALNISPEMSTGRLPVTLSIDDLLDGKLRDHSHLIDGRSVAANMWTFSRERQGFMAELMDSKYESRADWKRKMIDAQKENEKNRSEDLETQITVCNSMQHSKKIQLNSFYGAVTNQYFRWFDLNNGEAITMTGQLCVRWIEKRVNEYLNKMLKSDGVDYVIASDTDSIYVNLKALVDTLPPWEDKNRVVAIIDKFCQGRMEPYISKCIDDLSEYMNFYQKSLFMKRESIADKAIWKAKKMYIMNVYNSEGVQYAEPKLKMMGIEAVRSSTPAVCRDAIKQTLKLIMNTDEQTVIDYIEAFRTRFRSLSFEEIARPRGVNGMFKYKDAGRIYKSGTPIHVKGSLLYNKLITDYRLQKKYEPISDGDKVKFCKLKMPNPIQDDVICSIGPIPEEFGLQKYLDYDTEFEKSYLEPIKSVLDIIGWEFEKRSTLMDFFS